MDKNFEEIIKELKALPIYAMSLGSKELFHSNFWAWLMDQDETKSLINLFFSEIDISKEIEVEREKGNRDITIVDKDGNAYVIENKIKSFPDEDQLKKYEASTSKFVRGVITGVRKPSFDLNGTKWTFISYKEIAEYLKDNVSPNATNPDLKNVLDQYIKMVFDIDKIIDQCFDATKDYYEPWPNEKYNLLKEIRLHDVYQKAKADELIKTVFEPISNNFKIDGFKLLISRDYHNVKPTLSLHAIPLDKNKNECWEKFLDIQIEGYQFRIFYRCHDKRVEEIFEDGKRIGWFDGGFDKKTNRKIRNYATSMSKPYCQYSNMYVYQYFDLWTKDKKQDLLSYENIKKLIMAELNRAKSILTKYRKEFIPPFSK